MKKSIKLICFILTCMLCVNVKPIEHVYAANLIRTASDFPDAPKLETNHTYTYSCGNKYKINKGVLADKYENYVRFDLENNGDYVLKWKGTGKVFTTDIVGCLYVYNSEWVKIYDNKDHNYADTVSVALSNLSTGTYYVAWERTEYGTISLTYLNPKSPTLNKNFKQIKIGSSYQLKLKNAPQGTINWVSGKTSVATVDKEGKVTAKKIGKANIYAIIDNKCYICKFKITN